MKEQPIAVSLASPYGDAMCHKRSIFPAITERDVQNTLFGSSIEDLVLRDVSEKVLDNPLNRLLSLGIYQCKDQNTPTKAQLMASQWTTHMFRHIGLEKVVSRSSSDDTCERWRGCENNGTRKVQQRGSDGLIPKHYGYFTIRMVQEEAAER